MYKFNISLLTVVKASIYQVTYSYTFVEDAKHSYLYQLMDSIVMYTDN